MGGEERKEGVYGCKWSKEVCGEGIGPCHWVDCGDGRSGWGGGRKDEQRGQVEVIRVGGVRLGEVGSEFLYSVGAGGGLELVELS